MASFIIGFIKVDHPSVLISPKSCASASARLASIYEVLPKSEYTFDPPLTIEDIESGLTQPIPVIIPVTGYKVAILCGCLNVVQNNTDRFVDAD